MSVLPGYCSEEGCDRPAGRLGKCDTCLKIVRDRERKENRPKKEVAYLQRSTTPIKKRSYERQDQEDTYRQQQRYWKRGKVCVMCEWEGKKNPNITCHHMQGREGSLLLDKKKWLPLCIRHHEWATVHSKEAIELGVSLPRNH